MDRELLHTLTNDEFVEIGRVIDNLYSWTYNDHFDDEKYYAINGEKNGNLIMLKIYYDENPRLVILNGEDFTEKTLRNENLEKVINFLENLLP